MTHASAMLETYPADLGGVDRQKLRETVADLTTCIRTHLDCADIRDTSTPQRRTPEPT